MKLNQKGTIILEAALAFPVFILSVICLITVLKVIYVHEIIEQSLYKAVNEISTSNIITNAACPEETYGLFVIKNIKEISSINTNNIKPDFTSSQYTLDGQICIEVKYGIKLPLGNMKKLNVLQRAVVKDWNKENYKSNNKKEDEINSIWDMHPLKRGRKIQEMYNRDKDIPHNFPVIARFNNKMAVSIKSINLNDKTYQKKTNAIRRINGLIDDLKEFNGGRVGAYKINQHEIRYKKIILVIPENCLNSKTSILSKCKKYARLNGIEIQIEGI